MLEQIEKGRARRIRYKLPPSHSFQYCEGMISFTKLNLKKYVKHVSTDNALGVQNHFELQSRNRRSQKSEKRLRNRQSQAHPVDVDSFEIIPYSLYL